MSGSILKVVRIFSALLSHQKISLAPYEDYFLLVAASVDGKKPERAQRMMPPAAFGPLRFRDAPYAAA
ncbi:hypothetical protein [Paenibacillus luteus]|uniref:hypothetical protein n=1 Tax=Paenibacillus luteus TaxID=2545753 RepID=UPI0019D52910|nr:hypothetical protein [Paenibacillus luteus]